MKSSEPVFTRKNPFPSEPHLPKSHYNPSRVKKIPKQQKKLALSPVRYNQRASPPDSPPCTTSLSPEDRRFLEGSLPEVLRAPPAVRGQQIFVESWPSTDRSSSPTSTDASQPQHTATSGTQELSVLAKYVERFRYGRPQSRLERQRLAADDADNQQFWWMSSSPPQPSSSTPTPTSKECFRGDFDSRNADLLGKHQLNTSLSPTRGLLGLSVLTVSDTSHCETAETEVLQLQERASRLLQKSEHSLSSGSSSVPISSEGLCSDFSSPVSVDESMRRPIVVPSLMDTANLLTCPSMSRGGITVASSALNSVGSRLRPEDDILFQWRLRRKMEQARQGSHMSTHNSALHQPLLNRLTLQTQPGLSFTPAPIEVTGNHVSPPAFEPVLPASTAAHSETCIQTKHNCITPSQIVPSTPSTREKGTLEPQNPGSLSQPHLRKHTDSSESLIELSRKQQCPSAQPPHPSERPDGHWYDRQDRGNMQGKGSIDVEKKEKKARPASRKKNSDRYLRDDEIAERKIRHRNARSQKHVKAKETSKDNKGHGLDKGLTAGIYSGGAPPPSPIQNTLGRVVSEVLFPGDDSPVQSRTPCFTSSSINTSPEPSQSLAPLPQSHVSPPCEVIGQLMQEAEDSDGLEFEDDPLLVVLRQQRKWVKEQLCEVDLMLDKFHED